MRSDLIIQQPDAADAPADAQADGAELLLLFHGVGSSAEDLQPLGEALATHRPQAWVVSVRSPHPSDLGRGWQWFSVQGVSEANRPARVAAAMPAFRETVGAWQQHTGIAPARTTLVGFSQGAIMALESTQPPGLPVAGRVIAIAGRYAQAPGAAPAGAVVHLMHGEQDRVMPVALAVEAAAQLQGLGVSVTLDRFAGLGHGVDARVVEAIFRRMNQARAELAP